MGLTFKDTANRSKVYLDGKPMGSIKKIVKKGNKEEWRYYPGNSKECLGKPFSTRQDCKKSLEERR